MPETLAGRRAGDCCSRWAGSRRQLLSWTAVLQLGVLGVALGLGLGIPTSLVYHAKLARVLAARGELPPRWWLSPTRLHSRLRGAERRAVLRWFYPRRRRLRDHAGRLRGGARRRAARGLGRPRAARRAEGLASVVVGQLPERVAMRLVRGHARTRRPRSCAGCRDCRAG